jgi:transforming growth factor-beta-induced protein
MTSNMPYSQATDMTFKFLPVICEKTIRNRGSITDIIESNEDFSIFNKILQKSRMQDYYNSLETDITLFVTSDRALHYMPDYVDKLNTTLARNIMTASTLNKRIPSEILLESYYKTQNGTARLLVHNWRGNIILNNHINVVKKNIMATNGIIHVIDDIVLPPVI